MASGCGTSRSSREGTSTGTMRRHRTGRTRSTAGCVRANRSCGQCGARPERFFAVDDFADHPRQAVSKALRNLHLDGKLLHVRRGLYWKGTVTPLGIAAPNPRDVLIRLYGERHGVGPAGTSAALALGLTTQMPRHPVYAVPYRTEGMPRARLVLRTGRRGDSRVRHGLSEQEVALLEVLDTWDDTVELDTADAVERLRTILRDRVRARRLVDAAAQEPPTVRERLRVLLDSDDALRPLSAKLPPASPTTSARAVSVFRPVLAGVSA